MRWTYVPLLALAAIGCGKSDFAKPTGNDNVLHAALDANLATLDPALTQDLVTGDVMRQVFEGLVRLSEKNEIEPCLAESWTVSPDGLTYKFKIRSGVKFHDGATLTAKDFVRTLNRNCQPAMRSPIAKNYLGDIVGVQAVIDGEAQTITGLTAPDETTLEIRIDKPRPYFIGKLTYPAAFVVGASTGEIKTPSAMVGTGPFKMVSYTPEQSAELSAFASYWGLAPQVSGIKLQVIKDGATRLNKFRSGELDYVGLPRQDVDAVRKDPDASKTLKEYPTAALAYLGLNKKAYPPFKDPRVRRAFAMAINKQALVDSILSGVVQTAESILPPNMPGHRSKAGTYAFNPQAARQLLGNTTLPPIELVWGGQSQDGKKTADSIVVQLIQNLGINASVRQLDWPTFLHRATNQQLGFFVGSWYADYLDPENFLSVTLSSYGQNRVAYDNPRFTELCRQADTMADPVKRIELYQLAETLVLEDAVWIPLYFERTYLAVNPRLSGLRRNLMGFLPHNQVRIQAGK